MRDEILRQHPGEADDVVDVLLRVDRGQRAAWFFQRVDDLRARSAQPGIECRELPGRTGSDDRDVEDVVARNRARRIEDRPGCLGHELKTPGQGIPAVGSPFDVVSDSSIAPVFGWGTRPVRSAQSGDDSGGRFQERSLPILECLEYANKRIGQDGDGMTLQTRDSRHADLDALLSRRARQVGTEPLLQGMDQRRTAHLLQLRLPRPGLTARRRSCGRNDPGPRRAWPRSPAVWRQRGLFGSDRRLDREAGARSGDSGASRKRAHHGRRVAGDRPAPRRARRLGRHDRQRDADLGRRGAGVSQRRGQHRLDPGR